MENKISSTAESVQFIYSRYLKNQIIVNRRYQRKLVWSLAEKQAFIDSLYHNYSVPLFLFATDEKGDAEKIEIIDGLQRLNAICAFIENEYPIEIDGKKGYFDLDTLADSRLLKDEKKLTQKQPVLERSICTGIVNYQLPISRIDADSKSIETVFRRINSYGRQLSEQEIRLAGAVGKFPDLVRKLSAQIRQDVSLGDKLALGQMGLISISDYKLRYGIRMVDIFWVKNQIITPANIRKSRDEELIGQILGYIILGEKYEPSKHSLDRLYQYEEGNRDYERINDAIDKQGEKKIVEDFILIHDTIDTLIEKHGKTLVKLLYGEKLPDGLFRSYQVIFLTFYNLIVKQSKRDVNYDKLIKKLSNVGVTEFDSIGSSKNWNSDFRNSKIQAVTGIIADAFGYRKKDDVGLENGITIVDNLLTLLRMEGTQYDYKQTCHDLTTGKFSAELVAKIVKTLTASANRPNSTAYVLLGVADKEASARQHKATYGANYKAVHSNAFFITGVECEVEKYHKGNFDIYLQRIKAEIKKNLVEKEIEQKILQNIRSVTYYGYEIIIFSLESGDCPCAFQDVFYIREGNECKAVTGAKEINALYSQFSFTR